VTRDEVELLGDEIANMNKASDHLWASLDRCAGLSGRENLSLEEQERLEALCSRFARLSDILTQRVMRLVDDLELIPGGTLLDRVFRAEKRGWVESADLLIRIRKLRNTIAHDYASENVAMIYSEVEQLTPELLKMVPRVKAYADDLARRFHG
jgi:hypothetical protein